MPDHPFFSYRGEWALTSDEMNKVIKQTARTFSGLNPAVFETHSLHIGGASALAASGINDSIIQIMGRWKSSAFLRYIRLSTQAFSLAADSLSAGFFDIDSVRRLCPGTTLTA